MKHFYYYYEWKDRPMPFPCLKRARYFCVNGPNQAAHYSVNLPFWVMDIAFNDEGTGWKSADRDEWESRAINELHLYPPGTRFETRHEAGAMRHSAFIQFTNGESCGLNDLYQNGRLVYKLHETPPKMIELMQKIAIIGHQRQESGFWEVQTLLFELISSLQQIAEERKNESDGTFSRNVDNFLRKNLSVRLTSAKLAGMMGISISQLNHRYQQETGSSPIRRQLEMRLEYAAGMVLNNNTLAEIADRLGFSSAFHLSRAFRKYFGVSPAEFRRRGGEAM